MIRTLNILKFNNSFGVLLVPKVVNHNMENFYNRPDVDFLKSRMRETSEKAEEDICKIQNQVKEDIRRVKNEANAT